MKIKKHDGYYQFCTCDGDISVFFDEYEITGEFTTVIRLDFKGNVIGALLGNQAQFVIDYMEKENAN